jgi:hypothetical protein
MSTGDFSCCSKLLISAKIQRQCLGRKVDDYIIGPYVIANRLGGMQYFDILQTTLLLLL